MQPFPDDPITVAVAAKLVNVHRTTLLRWIHAGLLPAWKRGPVAWGRKRHVVVSKLDVLTRCTEPVIVNRAPSPPFAPPPIASPPNSRSRGGRR